MKVAQVSNLAIIQVRGDGGLHQNGNGGKNGKKWSDSTYIEM